MVRIRLHRGHPGLNCLEALGKVGHLDLERLLSGAGVGRKLRYGIEILAPHEFKPAHCLIDASADQRLSLFAQTGERR